MPPPKVTQRYIRTVENGRVTYRPAPPGVTPPPAAPAPYVPWSPDNKTPPNSAQAIGWGVPGTKLIPANESLRRLFAMWPELTSVYYNDPKSSPVLQEAMRNLKLGTPEQEYEKRLGYVPAYWEDPQRIGLMHQYAQAIPEGEEPPPWLDVAAVESAYNYLAERNGGRPWYEWDYLNREDPAREFLQGMNIPPFEEIDPADFPFSANPETGIEPIQAVAQPNLWADYEKMPWYQKLGIDVLGGRGWGSELVGRMAPAVASSALVGVPLIAATGGAATLPVLGFTAFGAATGAADYLFEEWKWDAARQVTNALLSVFGAPGIGVERLLGVGAQAAYSMADPERFGPITDLLADPAATWKSGSLFFSALPTESIVPGGAEAGQTTQLLDVLGPTELPSELQGQWWETTGLAMMAARKLVRDEGMAPSQAVAYVQQFYGLPGAFRTFALHSIVDVVAWNAVAGKGPKMVAGRVADVTGNVALKNTVEIARNMKLDGTTGLARAYGVYLRGSRQLPEIRLMDPVSRYLAGIDKEGQAHLAGAEPAPSESARKAEVQPAAPPSPERIAELVAEGMPPADARLRAIAEARVEAPAAEPARVSRPATATGMSKLLRRPAGLVEQLFGLDPRSRAAEIMFRAGDMTRLILHDRTYADALEPARLIVRIAKTGMAEAEDLSMRLLGTPDGSILVQGLRDLNTKSIEKSMKAYTATEPARSVLQAISDVLGEKIGNVRLRLLEPSEHPAIMAEVTAKAALTKTPAATKLTAAIKAGKFTEATLARVAKAFSNVDVPVNAEMYHAQLSQMIVSHIADWSIRTLGVKVEPTVLRLNRLIIGMQNLVILDLNPLWALINGVSNLSHLVIDGAFSPNNIGRAQAWWTDFGFVPSRLREGFGGPGGLVDLFARSMGPVEAKLKASADPQDIALIGQLEALHKLGAVTEGRGAITVANRWVSALRNKVGVARWFSSKFEEWGSVMANTVGAQKWWNASWRRGLGFDRLPPQIEAALGPDLANLIYATIESKLQPKQIVEAFQPTTELRANWRANLDEVARELGEPVERVLETMRESGAAELLERKLPQAKTDADIRAIEAEAEALIQDHINNLHVEDVVTVARQAATKTAARDWVAVLEQVYNLNAEMADYWTQHSVRMADIVDKASQIRETVERDAFVVSKRATAEAEATRMTQRERATIQGIVEALREEGIPWPEDYVGMLDSIAEGRATFFTKRRVLWDEFWSQRKWAKGERAIRYREIVDELNADYSRMVDEGLAVQKQMDDAVVRMVGEAGGDDALATRLDQYFQEVRDIRRSSAELEGRVRRFTQDLTSEKNLTGPRLANLISESFADKPLFLGELKTYLSDLRLQDKRKSTDIALARNVIYKAYLNGAKLPGLREYFQARNDGLYRALVPPPPTLPPAPRVPMPERPPAGPAPEPPRVPPAPTAPAPEAPPPGPPTEPLPQGLDALRRMEKPLETVPRQATQGGQPEAKPGAYKPRTAKTPAELRADARLTAELVLNDPQGDIGASTLRQLAWDLGEIETQKGQRAYDNHFVNFINGDTGLNLKAAGKQITRLSDLDNIGRRAVVEKLLRRSEYLEGLEIESAKTGVSKEALKYLDDAARGKKVSGPEWRRVASHSGLDENAAKTMTPEAIRAWLTERRGGQPAPSVASPLTRGTIRAALLRGVNGDEVAADLLLGTMEARARAVGLPFDEWAARRFDLGAQRKLSPEDLAQVKFGDLDYIRRRSDNAVEASIDFFLSNADNPDVAIIRDFIAKPSKAGLKAVRRAIGEENWKGIERNLYEALGWSKQHAAVAKLQAAGFTPEQTEAIGWHLWYGKDAIGGPSWYIEDQTMTRGLSAMQKEALRQVLKETGWGVAPEGAPIALGFTTFYADGQALLYAFSARGGAPRGVATLAHEVAHIFLADLGQAEKQRVLAWAQRSGLIGELGKGGELWQNIHVSEAFADGFVKWLAKGEAVPAGLEGAFSTFRTWLTAVFREVESLARRIGGVPVDEGLSNFFHDMLSKDPMLERDTAGPVRLTDATKAMDAAPYGPLTTEQVAMGTLREESRRRGVYPRPKGFEAEIMASGKENMTAEQGIAEARMASILESDPEGTIAITRQRMAESGSPNIADPDLARLVSPDYLANPQIHTASTLEPATALATEIYFRLLKEAAARVKAGESGRTLLLMGGSGSGKSTWRGIYAGPESEYFAGYDASQRHYPVTVQRIERSVKAGLPVDLIYVYFDPVAAYIEGVVSRYLTGKEGKGRAITPELHSKLHSESRATFLRIADEVAGVREGMRVQPREGVDVMVFENQGAKGYRLRDVDYIRNRDYNPVEVQRLIEARLEEMVRNGELTANDFFALTQRNVGSSGTDVVGAGLVEAPTRPVGGPLVEGPGAGYGGPGEPATVQRPIPGEGRAPAGRVEIVSPDSPVAGPAGDVVVGYGADPDLRWQFQYRVVSARDILVSHNLDGSINLAFPEVLQPRNRSARAAMEQSMGFAAKPNFDVYLSDTPRIDDGTPIIGFDPSFRTEGAYVLSGNGRVIGLQLMMRDHPANYKVYVERLAQNAAKFGIDPAEIVGIDSPILVRELVGTTTAVGEGQTVVMPADHAAFSGYANVDYKLRMTFGETAALDAQRITTGMLAKLTVGEDVPLDQALLNKANEPFVQDFIASLPKDERGAMMLPDGSLSRPGIQRIVGAVFSRTFPGEAGSRIFQIVFEDPDSGIRNVGNGLTASLPRLAISEELVRVGQRLPEYSLADDLASAVSMMQRLKRQGMTAREYVENLPMFGRELTPFQERILVDLWDRSGSPKAIRQTFETWAKIVIDSPDARQESFTDIPVYTAEQLWNLAKERGQTTMFELPPGHDVMGSTENTPEMLPIGKLTDDAHQTDWHVISRMFDKIASTRTWEKVYPPDSVVGRLTPEQMAMFEAWVQLVTDQMTTNRYAAVQWGQTVRNFTLLNYNGRIGADAGMFLFWPYSFWPTRTMMNWALRAIDKPAILAVYAEWRRMREQFEKPDGFPTRLRNKVPLTLPWLPDWMGDRVWIDPLKNWFPPDLFLGAAERAMMSSNQVEQQAERILSTWVDESKINAEQMRVAVETHEGDVWTKAMSEATAQYGNELQDPIDYLGLILAPSLPWQIVHELWRGQPENLGPMPATRTIKALTAAAGLNEGRGVNIEQPLRRAVGLPDWDKYEPYREDRILMGMVMDGEVPLEVARLAMIQREGPIFVEAQRRVEQGRFYGTYANPLWWLGFPGDSFPPGEAEARALAQKYERAWQERRAGNPDALQNFFEAYPEYRARMASLDDPDQRLKDFLVDELWLRYNALNRSDKEVARIQLGPQFELAFLNKDTRSVESLSPETLARWGQMLGGVIPERAPGVNGYDMPTSEAAAPVQVLPPEVSQAVSDFRDERDAKFPNWYSVQSQYYDLPERSAARNAWKKRKWPWTLEEYWDWRRDYIDTHPDIAPYIQSYDVTSPQGEQIGNVSAAQIFADPILSRQIYQASFAGVPLTSGAWEEVTRLWEEAGMPGTSPEAWLGELAGAYRYGQGP